MASATAIPASPASTTPSHRGRARDVGDAGRGHAGADRQTRVRVDAHRLRVGRAEDEVPARAGAVLPAAREQLATDAACPAAPARRRRARSPRRPRGSAPAPRRPRARRARPPSCRRGRSPADGGCARAGGPPARPLPRPRRSCRARRAQTRSASATSSSRIGRMTTSCMRRRDSNPARPRCSTLRGRSWPSPSRSSRTPAREAPRPAQDLGADLQRVPDVPQPAPAASGLPDVRLLRAAARSFTCTTTSTTTSISSAE